MRFATVIIPRLVLKEFFKQTCDKRSPMSSLKLRYPFKFEQGFGEKDEMWKADERETEEQQRDRLHAALSALFDEDQTSTYVSLSAHSGTIRSILQSVNYPRVFDLRTGGMIPVVGKL